MTVSIHIDGATAEELLAQMQTLLRGAPIPVFSIDAEKAIEFAEKAGRSHAAARATAEEVPAGEEKAFPEVKPARKPRAPKAEIAAEPEPTTEAAREAEADALAETPETVEQLDATEPSNDQVFTLDDARKALGDLLAQDNGKDKAKAVFAEFSATKISDIAEGQIKGFIAAIAKQRGL